MNVKRLAYSVARSLGAFALCRRLTRAHVRVLAYHGGSVGDEDEYNPLLFIAPETFRRRIEWLRRKGFHVIGLDEAVKVLDGEGRVPALPTVITFDDGWYTTATQLIPILAEMSLPSTLYLHTGHIDESWPVLPVVVGYMLWKCGRATIEVNGLGAGMDGTIRLDDRPARVAFVQRSCEWLAPASATAEIVVERLHQLASAVGVDADDLALQTRRFDYVSRDELLGVAGRACAVELHGHEHHYPAGDPDTFAADLERCRRAIVGLGLPAPRHYCYPSGAFDAAATGVLDRMGVRSATTCMPGLIHLRRDAARRHYLPRFLDGDHIDMLTFEAEMSGFADLLRRAAGR